MIWFLAGLVLLAGVVIYSLHRRFDPIEDLFPVIKIQKPWGHEEIWAQTDDYVGKILVIKAGHRLSLQFHRHKDETIHVVSGELSLFLDNQDGETTNITLIPGESFHISPFVIHRMAAKKEDVRILEVSTTQLWDVVRLEDDYSRTL